MIIPLLINSTPMSNSHRFKNYIYDSVHPVADKALKIY